jgi:Leucine-rich repeat (LRR) protein
MALPSSPPLMAEANLELPDIPSSPPLPPTFMLPSLPHGRKRQLSEYDNTLSSDPLFSEDTTDNEDLAAYDRPRRKRMIRGPWYSMGKRPAREAQVRLHAASNGQLQTADSGVWLGSDASEESTAILLQSQRKLQALQVRDWAGDGHSGEKDAERIVNACVEEGKEAVDLSNLDLRTLSSDTLRPLHQLIRHTHANLTQPPSEDQFSSLTPSIQLFLASNKLATLPAELFRLQNISVLSLRNCRLTEMPSAIRRLPLKELNMAGNQIRYLPWELLDLMDGQSEPKKVYVRPNPLVEPVTIAGPSRLPDALAGDETEGLAALKIDCTEDFHAVRQRYAHGDALDIRTELEMRLHLGRKRRTQHLEMSGCTSEEKSSNREEVVYLASSALHYYDVDGAPLRTPCGVEEQYAAKIDDFESPPRDTSRAPSLLELGLRCAQRDYDLFNLPDGLPLAVRRALDKAATGLDFGNQSCSTCGQAVVIPRADWMEYWFIGSSAQVGLTQDSVLPFLRKACSWKCAIPSEVGTYRL